MDEILAFTHRLLAHAATPGCFAVDATAGNGHDTLHLARLVGSVGHVLALDIQEDALRATRRRLQDAELESRVTLLRTGHERMSETVAEVLSTVGRAAIRAVSFNLGYLPGGDKSLVTRPETTLDALRAAVDLLDGGGVVTVVAYTGHPGGTDERDAVLRWASGLAAEHFRVLHYRFANRQDASELIAIEKRNA